MALKNGFFMSYRMNRLSAHQRGLFITIIGVVILSPDALLVRLMETNHWVIVFWRGLFSGVSFFVLSAFIEKESFFQTIRGLLEKGLLCALFFAGGNICFIISITHTSAANTLVILASMPFLAAIFAVILVRKKIPFRVWMTMFICMAGIAVVFWGRFGEGRIYGDFFALLAAAFTAAVFVAVNKNPTINTLASVGLGSILTAFFALFMGASPGAASNTDLVYLILNGGIIFPVAMGLITFGPKLISAPEVSLIMLLETVLGPLWVWLVLSEAPSQQTFTGGVIVIIAIVINATLGFRTSDKALLAPPPLGDS